MHSIINPHRLVQFSLRQSPEEWTDEYALVGFILAIHVFLLVWLIFPAYGSPDGYADASLGDKLVIVSKHLAPVFLAASVLLGAAIFAIGLLLLLLSRRRVNRRTTTTEVRVCRLMPIPFVVFSLLGASNWFSFAVSDPAARVEADQILAGGPVTAENLLPLISLAARHWQFWAVLSPWVLCTALLIFMGVYFVITGWRERAHYPGE